MTQFLRGLACLAAALLLLPAGPAAATTWKVTFRLDSGTIFNSGPSTLTTAPPTGAPGEILTATAWVFYMGAPFLYTEDPLMAQTFAPPRLRIEGAGPVLLDFFGRTSFGSADFDVRIGESIGPGGQPGRFTYEVCQPFGAGNFCSGIAEGSVAVTPIPLPGTALLLPLGLAGLVALGRRHRG